MKVVPTGLPEPEELEEDMRAVFESDDHEEAHVRADELMLKILRACGFDGAADVFESSYKWYA